MKRNNFVHNILKIQCCIKIDSQISVLLILQKLHLSAVIKESMFKESFRTQITFIVWT